MQRRLDPPGYGWAAGESSAPGAGPATRSPGPPGTMGRRPDLGARHARRPTPGPRHGPRRHPSRPGPERAGGGCRLTAECRVHRAGGRRDGRLHGHLDGRPDRLVVGLRRRGDGHDSEPGPHVHPWPLHGHADGLERRRRRHRDASRHDQRTATRSALHAEPLQQRRPLPEPGPDGLRRHLDDDHAQRGCRERSQGLDLPLVTTTALSKQRAIMRWARVRHARGGAGRDRPQRLAERVNWYGWGDYATRTR